MLAYSSLFSESRHIEAMRARRTAVCSFVDYGLCRLNDCARLFACFRLVTVWGTLPAAFPLVVFTFALK
jgi:hypothetical protein